MGLGMQMPGGLSDGDITDDEKVISTYICIQFWNNAADLNAKDC